MPRRASKGSGQPRISVLVLNYNGLRWLPRCLSSLSKTKYPNYDVHLIDNGSSDASLDYVRRSYPKVRIIRNSINLGFAEAYNEAINKIETEYVVFLNNDTEVLNPNWLDQLVRAMDQRTNVAAVSAKLVSMRDQRLLDSIGGVGLPYWKGFFDVGRGEIDVGQYKKDFEPFSYCGGAALIRRTAFIDAGRLDSEFFAYFDDPDLSWRLRLRGWQIGYAPNARIAHYHGGTEGEGQVTPSIVYYCNRNYLRTIIKNCGPSLLWALRSYLLYTLVQALGFIVYEPKKSFPLVRGIFWNIRNLRSSYALRLGVQMRREVAENEILRRMYPGLVQLQTPNHPSLARVVSFLFDWGSRRKFEAMITS